MKTEDLLLVTNLSSFLIKNGGRFRTVLGALPLLVLSSVYAVACIAALQFVDLEKIGSKIYLYVLLLATAATLMVCYAIVSNFALRNWTSDAESVIAKATPTISWRYLEPGLVGLFALAFLLARLAS